MASIREQILQYGLGIAVVSPSATHYRYLNLLSLNDCLLESIALLSRGHEVLVSTPEIGGAIVREAGLAHALSGFPDEEDLREIWDSLPKMSPPKAEETVLTQLFANRYPRAALPALRETIQRWKPNLIIRESMEFAAVIAAAEANIPIVRVAVTNAEFEARVLRGALGPVDVLRQEACPRPDRDGASRLAQHDSSMGAT